MLDITHEDRRIKVIEDLRSSILDAIEEIKNTDMNIYYNLQTQIEQYEKLIKERKDIPLIIKNERIIEAIGRPDIEVFGGKLIFEIKKSPSEYTDGLNQLNKYEPYYPYAEYAILTNYYDDWYFYKINKEKEIERLSQINLELKDIIKNILIKGVKISLTAENIKNLYRPISLLKEDMIKVYEENNIQDDALFKAYKNIMERLYEDSLQEKIEDLFIYHTLMQMIISSCLTCSFNIDTTSIKACVGSEIKAEIVLPYLKWWNSIVLNKPNGKRKEFLKALTNSIYSKALLLNWEEGQKEDVFRELYEILISTETRRIIGEYYTPYWLTEFMTKQINVYDYNLKNKIILDPFCGSGTFLVSSFYEKVKFGVDAEKAINEVIGFDINPIAVSVARAELLIAFFSQKGKIKTPLVFNIDSASLLLQELGKWKEISFLEELRVIEKVIGFIDSPVYKANDKDLPEILKIEVILRECFSEAISYKNEDLYDFLENKLNELINGTWEGGLTSDLVKILKNDKCLISIKNLIEKYGNGVWAVSLTSLIAPHIIKRIGVDIIISNPPWNQLSKIKGSYGELLRGKAKEILKGYKKTSQIISGSDISSILLYGSLKMAVDKVSFLMPQESVYVSGSYSGLGKLLTYGSSKNYKGEIIQILYDVFQHGMPPCITLLECKRGKKLCYNLRIQCKEPYSKTIESSKISYSIEKKEGYNTYIENILKYLESSSEEIGKLLKIEQAVPKAEYIMGVLGGRKKKSEIKYAGLIFKVENVDVTTDQNFIKLSNLENAIGISSHSLNPYWKKIIYISDIFPFYLSKVRNILLSSIDQNDLITFLKTTIFKNLSNNEKIKMKLLIENLKQPKNLNPLEKDKYYVFYKSMRTFASVVFTPQDLILYSNQLRNDIIVYEECGYLVTSNESKAYYYASILNYLAYKVIQKGGAFERRQYKRPLNAIINANLTWQNKKWQHNIAMLSKELHEKASLCLSNYVFKGLQIKSCYDKLEECEATKNLIKDIFEIIEHNSNNELLEKALKGVAKFI